MKIRNPFKKRTLLWITPKHTSKITIPFIGKMKVEKIKQEKIKGYSYDSVMVDEVMEKEK